VFTGAECWRDIGNHGSSTVARERAFQNLGEFTASEWEMRLLQIHCSYAFLQSKQGFVYFSTVNPCLLIGFLNIGTSFRTCQIDERDHSVALGGIYIL